MRTRTDVLLDALAMVDEDMVRQAWAQRRRVRPWRQAAAVLAAVLLCLTTAATAVAADVEPAYRALYALSPALAQRLKPVRLRCTDNGVEMEVISARVQGDTAQVYLALRDLTGDRVDGTTDLFDSCSIHCPVDASANCRLVDFAADTGTATFLFTLTQMEGKALDGTKLTFSVGEFLSHKTHTEGDIPAVTVTGDFPDAQWQGDVTLRGGGGEDYEKLRDEPVLVPQGTLAVPVPGVTVTAVGRRDGQVHVQLRYDDILRTDNHGWVCLRDSAGEEVQPVASVSFWAENGRDSYEEYIFPQGREAGQLHGKFWTCHTLTKGSWQVTFPLEGD